MAVSQWERAIGPRYGTRPVLSSILVAPRNALGAREELLLAAPGTCCETAMHGIFPSVF
eukprot:COSAG01_NODE_15833_length_1294_cov_38.056904_1_plen_59_part_00